MCVQGPREDTGFSSGVDTGVQLASQVYAYCKKYHPKTQVMASGLRTKEGEAGLARLGANSVCQLQPLLAQHSSQCQQQCCWQLSHGSNVQERAADLQESETVFGRCGQPNTCGAKLMQYVVLTRVCLVGRVLWSSD